MLFTLGLFGRWGGYYPKMALDQSYFGQDSIEQWIDMWHYEKKCWVHHLLLKRSVIIIFQNVKLSENEIVKMRRMGM